MSVSVSAGDLGARSGLLELAGSVALGSAGPSDPALSSLSFSWIMTSVVFSSNEGFGEAPGLNFPPYTSGSPVILGSSPGTFGSFSGALAPNSFKSLPQMCFSFRLYGGHP